MIPELVKELINWYRWREKIKRVLVEYHQKVETWGDVEFIKYRMGGFINYRNISLLEGFDYIYHKHDRVALLPNKYLYSSGLSNREGYKSLRGAKYNISLPDFIDE